MIRLRELVVEAGSFQIGPVSMELPAGGYAVLMGRTGSGKTTILEAVCGLRRIVRGSIELAGRDVTALRPAARGVGYVPQDLALFSTMSVHDHLAFALRLRSAAEWEIERRVAEMADLLGIRYLLHRRPQGLSGGEAQRVALGRALSSGPGILLLDEPLSALDDQTRHDMYALMRAVRGRTGVTTLHVTHNLEEAERLADQVYVVENGAVAPASAAELRARRSGGARP